MSEENDTPTSLKLNLGSGSRGLAGWTNVDVGSKYSVWRLRFLIDLSVRLHLVGESTRKWLYETSRPPPNWKKWDLRKRLPLPDSSAQFVYCGETIEHFEHFRAQALLSEAFRVLRPRGVLRITTPDIGAITRAYLSGEMDATRFNEFFYFPLTNYTSATFLERLAIALNSTRYHVWLYDWETLKSLLTSVGFRAIVRLPIGQGRMADISELEHYDSKELQHARVYSMYVEALKP